MNWGLIGASTIAAEHMIGALRACGADPVWVVSGSLPHAQRFAAERGVARAGDDLAVMLADPGVEAVYISSTNEKHRAQALAAIGAGKHVICEKPLAMTSAQSGEMLALARASGKIAAVCYNTRFYPLNSHARGMVAAGDLGDIRLISGQYHQDWLARPTDWNWRLEAEEGGVLRSVGDIGTHWVDLTSFITGQCASAVLAELATFVPERQKPLGRVETFSTTTGATETRRITTDDAATILLRYPNGARGVMSTSQISQGRKNAMTWEIAGSSASAAWHSETPDHLWIGHRDAPNQILQRDAALMNPMGAAAASLPGGHVEGFADTFHALFGQVYADVAQGARGSASTYAGFDDGHYEMLFCDAVLQSARTGAWVDVEQV